MKCCNCPALRTAGYEYPTTYCALGIPDEDTIVFKDLELGCHRRSKTKIIKQVKEADEQENAAFVEHAEVFVNFIKEHNCGAKMDGKEISHD